MKTIAIKLSLLFLLFSSCGYLLNPRYVNMPKKTKEKYALPKLEKLADYYENPKNVYAVNATKLRELIQASKRKNILVVFFAYWCGPCHQSMPEVKKFYEDNKDQLEIFFISSVDWLEVNSDRQALNKYGFKNHPLLSIDLYEYGTKYMNWKRLNKFTNELIPGYSAQIALPTYLLFDNTCQFIASFNSEFGKAHKPLIK